MKFHIRNLFLVVSLTFFFNVYAFNFEETTIESIHDAIKTQKLSCEKLIAGFIERIKIYNLSMTKPSINAITQINPSALDEARELDNHFLNTLRLKGTLHCVPVILKDNIDSFDTITTTGSFALIGNQPPQDAALVKQLRAAGAIILAKGGMDEFASNMIGISSRSGRIGNAYDTSKNPGGSSGGPAAAVSANFAVIGIGTDNSGSIRIPAVFNGLVGLRPSMDIVSQAGIFPMGNLDATAGPMARNVKDLAITLDILTTSDATTDSQRKSYTSFLNAESFQNKRIAIVKHVGKLDTFREMPDEIKKIITAATKKMQELGAKFIEIDLPDFNHNRKFNEAGEIQDINTYLKSFPATRTDFRDICLSGRTRTFGNDTECLKYMKKIANHDSNDYVEAKKIFEKNRNYVETIMKRDHIDALLVPISTQGSATYDVLSVNTWRAAVSSNAGLPAIAFVVGYDSNQMPVGLELIGKKFDEGKLISFAYAFEINSSKRLLPKLPEPNQALKNYSIPMLNNLYTQIGATSYAKILKHVNQNTIYQIAQSADAFQQIITNEIKVEEKNVVE